MKGFDPRWRDFPDYILGVTKTIWEDRGLDTLRHYYASDMPVRSPAGLVVGNEGVIAATMATLAEFPDRELLGEDVIWCGDAEQGMLSSHRILSTATHLGSGVYGPATGKRLHYRIIADCYASADRIRDEWLIRDQGAIVRQLGWDPADYARAQIAREGGPEAASRPFTPARDVAGPYTGTGNDNAWGARYADLLNRIMAGDLAAIPAEYDRAIQATYAGHRHAVGRSEVDRFWLELRASFPSARFTIDHQIGRSDDLMPPRAALRWSLWGKHDGWGGFGPPTGAEVYVMGAAHAEFGPWGLRREVVLYDETAIWKQIALQAG